MNDIINMGTWEELFVKETMAPYLTTPRGHFRE